MTEAQNRSALRIAEARSLGRELARVYKRTVETHQKLLGMPPEEAIAEIDELLTGMNPNEVMARDPRDAAVSRMLYRWHKGFGGQKKQYEAHLDLVLKKEKDPKVIPFVEICRYTGHNGSPRSVEEVIKEERHRYRQMSKFVQSLGSDWRSTPFLQLHQMRGGAASTAQECILYRSLDISF